MGDVLYGLAWVAVFGVIYLTPTIAAQERRHPQTAAIFALNLLLGWTLLGWVAALVWALSRPAPRPALRAGGAAAAGVPRVRLPEDLFCPDCRTALRTVDRWCPGCGLRIETFVPEAPVGRAPAGARH